MGCVKLISTGHRFRLLGRLNHANINTMATCYRPSEKRHKRWVYRSIDPDEPKRFRRLHIKIVIAAFTGLAILWLLSNWPM